MNTIWNVYGQGYDIEAVKNLLLQRRGFEDLSRADVFLHPKNPLLYLKDFPNDFKLSLKEATKLINSTIEKNLPIVIHGDYDADGICATSILYNYLTKERKYGKAFYFIPSRFDQGYGLSEESLDESIRKVKEGLGVEEEILFITVDSGITSVGEVEYLRKLGHKIIITDHHQKARRLPKADIIVWNDQVVGATIAWILTRVLGSKNPDYLALASLATVTDVYPVLGLNRALVKQGLKLLNISPPLGLKELISVSGLDGKSLDTYHLGWVLGPRINASGRLSNASLAVDLLTVEEQEIALSTARELNKMNKERQDETYRMYSLVPKFEEVPRFILTESKDFHEGLIGLVASRLVRKYYRPSVVISVSEKFGKGSVRSIEGINVIDLLREFEDLFVNLGGHPMAAGFTIPLENIPILEEKLRKAFEERFEDSCFVSSLTVDAEIPINLVTWELLDFIQSLKPFGTGNKAPLFLTRGLGIASMNFVGKEKNHVSLKFYDGNNSKKGIFFSSREYFDDITLGDKVDVVYSIEENNYRGNSTLNLIVKDLHKIY